MLNYEEPSKRSKWVMIIILVIIGLALLAGAAKIIYDFNSQDAHARAYSRGFVTGFIASALPR